MFIYDEQGRSEIPCDRWDGPLKVELDEFRRSIILDQPMPHDGKWGKATLEVCLAMLQSSRDHSEQRLCHQVASPDERGTDETEPEFSKGAKAPSDRPEACHPERMRGDLRRIFLCTPNDNDSNLSGFASLMKIQSRSHLQFLQTDLIAEFLQPVNAAFCYSLTVALIKVVSTQIGISLFAS